MRKISIGIGLATFVTLMMLMSVGTAMADTEAHVDWNSPNPDIHVGTSGPASPAHNFDSSSAWASVSGSGDSASGVIGVSNTFSGAGKKTAWQTADFEGGNYTASVGTRYRDDIGNNVFSSSQGFEVEDADTASVGQEVSSKLDSFQSYEATSADSVTAGGSVTIHRFEDLGSVTYTGNAHGDVSGSQGSSNIHWKEESIGFGAGISGTEGTTTFDFAISNAEGTRCYNPGTLHTTVISSDESTVFGEAKTWEEDSPLDEDFNWIE